MATIDEILERQSRGDSDFWNNTLANIANVVMSLPERRARADAQRADAEYRQSRLDLARQELQGKQQELMSQRLVNGIAAKYIRPSTDGSYQTVDRAGLAKALAEAGQPPETWMHYSKMLDEFESSAKRMADSKAQNIADIAAAVLKSNQNPSAAEVAFGLSLAKKNHPEITDEQLRPFYEAMESGKDLRPALAQILGQFDREGKHKDLLKPKEPQPLIKHGAEESIYDPNLGRDIVTGKPKPPDYKPGTVEFDIAQYAKSVNKSVDDLTQPEIDAVRAKHQEAVPTAEMRQKAEARKAVASSIKEIEDLSKEIFLTIGPAQRALAIGRGAATVFGLDPRFRKYQRLRKAMAGNLAVAQQGGRPSDADVRNMLELIPDPYGDTAQSAPELWDAIRALVGVPKANGEAKDIELPSSGKPKPRVPNRKINPFPE